MNFNYNTHILNNNNIHIPQIQFKSVANQMFKTEIEPPTDNFATTNPLYEYFIDKDSLTKIAKNNPKIQEILKENNLRLNVNIEELEKLKTGHLMDTRVTTAKIYSALPSNLKENINPIDLQQAAMLHDYGKVLIPEKILKKNGELNPKEKKIMHLHSELGYELLKSQGVKPRVLQLVKYHHQTPDGNGYPKINDGFKPAIETQIINAADKYCALREPRSYKEPLERNEALDILQEDVNQGLISEEVYNALKSVV